MSGSSSAQAASILVPAPGGFWRDFFDSFFRPAERFGRLRSRPQWVASLLILAFLSVFITALHQSVVPYANQARAKIDQAEKIAGPLSDAEKERRLSQHPGIASQVSWLGLIAGFTAFTVLVCALAFWGAVVISGRDMHLSTVFSVTAHAMLPPSVAWTLCATLVLFIQEVNTIDPVRLDNVVMSNLGVVFNLGGSHPFWQSLLGSIDVFSIWTVALMAVGISACTSKTPLSKSLVITGTVWGIYIVAKGLFAIWMPAMA